MYEVNEKAIQEISLTKIDSEVDRNAILQLRYEGYRGVFESPESSLDEFDKLPTSQVLLARDSQGVPIGTVRLLSTAHGGLELDSLNPSYKDYFTADTTFVEGTRLVAKGSEIVPKQSVQAALWKTALDYAYHLGADHLIVWSKRGPDRAYRYLKFNQLPECGFCHYSLGAKRHEVFTLNLQEVKDVFRHMEHPLYDFFFEKRYANLIWY